MGDPFFPAEALAEPIRALGAGDDLTLLNLGAEADLTRPHSGIREYVGSAKSMLEVVPDHDALVVHAAPVTAEVLDASTRLAIVCCARGGPVNVDVDAAAQRGIRVVTAPGKNAQAVAELTLAFIIMLARRICPAIDALVHDGHMGDSVVEGAAYMGAELGGRRLGLVGYGHVGGLVAAQALSCGMLVGAFDPYIPDERMRGDGVEPLALDLLLAQSDFVSLHARASADNENMIDAPALAAMRPSAYLVNTARESLVDEEALRSALDRGQLAGAALDVLRPRPDGARNPLVGLDKVIVTPHIGGATVDTLRRGAEMMAQELQRFRAGEPLLNVAHDGGVAKPAVSA